MKIIKMKIKRTRTNKVTHYDYPACFDGEKVKWGPFYEGALQENIDIINQRGLDDEYIVFGVEDTDAAEFLKGEGAHEFNFDFEAQEITSEQALIDGNKWTKQIEGITDMNKVVSILAKIGREEELTQAEKDVLNPEKSEIGINKSKSFEESINGFLAK